MKSLTIFLVVIFSCVSFASGPDIRTGYLYAKKKTSLKNILYYQAGIPKKLVNDNKFIDSVYEKNPFLERGELVNKGQQLYIEVPYSLKFVRFLRKRRIKPKKRQIASTPKTYSEIKISKDNFLENDKTWSLSSFYTTSVGSFNEEVNGVSATSNQNSPITVGASLGIPINNDYSFSGSLYFSTLEETGVSDSSESASIPAEYGVTTHFNINRFNIPITPFIGLDYESFSTFNTDERFLGEKLSTREHNILYGSFGFSKLFTLFKRPAYIKAGVSQSFVTKSSRKSLLNSKEFSGQKLIFFFSTPVVKNFSAHFLFKQHLMEGPTSLSISRYGLGVSYKFF